MRIEMAVAEDTRIKGGSRVAKIALVNDMAQRGRIFRNIDII
jgi:hypothetical protein